MNCPPSKPTASNVTPSRENSIVVTVPLASTTMRRFAVVFWIVVGELENAIALRGPMTMPLTVTVSTDAMATLGISRGPLHWLNDRGLLLVCLLQNILRRLQQAEEHELVVHAVAQDSNTTVGEEFDLETAKRRGHVAVPWNTGCAPRETPC